MRCLCINFQPSVSITAFSFPHNGPNLSTSQLFAERPPESLCPGKGLIFVVLILNALALSTSRPFLFLFERELFLEDYWRSAPAPESLGVSSLSPLDRADSLSPLPEQRRPLLRLPWLLLTAEGLLLCQGPDVLRQAQRLLFADWDRGGRGGPGILGPALLLALLAVFCESILPLAEGGLWQIQIACGSIAPVLLAFLRQLMLTRLSLLTPSLNAQRTIV